MPIVDTHVHVIATDVTKYPRSASAPDWATNHGVDLDEITALFDGAGVDRAVIVQAYSAYGYDNAYTIDCAARNRGRFSGVAIIDAMADGAAETLRGLVEQRGMRGLRLFTTIEGVSASWLDDPKTLAVWQMAERLGIPMAVQMRQPQLPQLERVVSQFPNVKVALDHVAGAPVDDGPPFRKAQPLFDLARLPNLHIKFSTVTILACQQANVPAQAFMKRLVEAFGAERLLWGSNYPASYNPSYSEMVGLAKDAVAPFSQREQALMLGEAALSLWPELA